MAKAFNPKARETYVLVADRGLDPSEQSKFFFRHLDVFEDMDLEERFKRREGVPAHEYGLEVLRRSLTGWENYNLDQAPDQPAAFSADEDGRATDDTIRALGRNIVELTVFAFQVNGATVEQVGKSLRQSTQHAARRTPGAPTADATQPASEG